MNGEVIWQKQEARGATEPNSSRAEAMDALVRDWQNSPAAIDDKLLVITTGPDKVAISQPQLSDGMGSLAPEIREWFDIIIEPGAQLTAHPAPFEGLTSDEVSAILAGRHG